MSKQLEAAIVKLAMKLADRESDMIALEASYDRMYQANRRISDQLYIATKALESIVSAHNSGCVDYKGCECWWQNAEKALKEIEK
jgi:hypothetical protein